MEIIKDNLSHMDCLMKQQMAQARKNKKGKTAKSAEKVMESRMKE